MKKYVVLSLLFSRLGAIHETSSNEELEVFIDYVVHRPTIGNSLCGEKPIATEYLPLHSKTSVYVMSKVF
ncbi:MAG: hypothetical protein ACSNEK_04855 [Parachlamydiaceae bacterium]